MQAIIGLATKAVAAFSWKAVGTWALKTTLLTAASYGVGRLVAPKGSGLTGSAVSGLKLEESHDIMQARRIIYGRDRVAGTARLRHQAGTNGEYLYYIVVWAGHECDAIEEFKLGDELVTFDGSGNAEGTFAGVLRCTHHLGAWDQAADANFVAEIPSIWTNNHRGRGCCYSALRFKWDQAKFPGGLPQPTARIRGRKIYDWRDEDQDPEDPSTWTWSANPPLCRADYIRGVPMLNSDGELVRMLGLRLPDERIKTDVLVASANACDEDVDLAAGGTEKRYELHGSFTCDSDHASVLASMESADAGRTIFIGGEAYIRSGFYVEPDFHLTESMLRTGQRRTRNPLSKRERFNLVTGTFVDPAAGYQRTQMLPVKSDTFIGEDGGELPRQMDLPFTQSETMGQRIMRSALLRSRQGIMYNCPCNLQALPALTGENILISRVWLGWEEKPFELLKFKLSLSRGDRGGVGIATEIVGQETDPSIWDWNTSLEQLRDPAPNTTLNNPTVAATPGVPTLLSDQTTVVVQLDGTTVSGLKISWTLAPDQRVISGGFYDLRLKIHGSGNWQELPSVSGAATETFVRSLEIGEEYDVEIRSRNSQGGVSDWVSAAAPVEIVGDTEAPDALTGVTATAYPGYNRVEWPASDAIDIGEYIVERATNSGFSAGLVTLNPEGTPEAFWDDNTATPGTTYYYRVYPVDRSENQQATPSNTASVTTAPAPVSNLTPADPTAATKTGEGTYRAGDGTAFAYLEFSVPAMPANSVRQLLLYRRNVSGEFMVAAQLKNTGSATIRIDDLSPGVTYQVATQSWSATQGSTVVAATSSPFTAPVPGAPAAPTGLSVSTTSTDMAKVPALYSNAPSKYGAALAKWTPSTDPHAYQELGGNTGPGFVVFARVPAGVREWPVYAPINVNPVTDTLGVRAIAPGTGTASSWASLLLISSPFTMDYGPGNMAEQNKTAVAIDDGYATFGGFEANLTTAIDSRGWNLRIFDSFDVQTARFDAQTGALYNNFNKVVGDRVTGWGAAPTDGTRTSLNSSSSQSDHNAALRQVIADFHATAGHGALGT